MKNLLMLLSAVCWLMITSCNKEEATADPSDGVTGGELTSRTPPNAVALCHLKSDGTFELKNVPQNAVQAHLNHGDKLLDVDGDGYTAVDACSGSKNDCDDNNAAIHPGATEICDGLDNNCDGKTDAPQDINTVGAEWYFEDADGDGWGSIGVGNKFCTQPAGWVALIGDCDDDNASIHPGALDIPNDNIDQDCSGADSIAWPHCDCFTMEELQNLYTYTPWPFGWWSDVPGSCKDAPYDQLMEVWLTDVGQPSQNFNFSAQAGTINGNPFASCAKFNHLTNQFDKLCGGYTNAQNASNCSQILKAFINQMRATHPSWDYCVRFP